ncbi:cytochrome-c peroxidase [Cryomorphaceae bacterium 1068]|nr:cytochrome-c peroxidase [Cryomorphaceae bacterium 1068]
MSLSKIVLLVISGLIVLCTGLSQNPTRYTLKRPDNFPPFIQNNAENLTKEGVLLGRSLFYDTILSRDFSISCASCHKPENAFSDSGEISSKGVSGKRQRRNTPALFNLLWSDSFFWDGRVTSLESQAIEVVSGHTEMDLSWQEAVSRLSSDETYLSLFDQAFPGREIDSLLVADALAQFQSTLISNNSKYDRVLRGEDHFTEEEYKGFVFVNDQSMGNCLHCHTTDAHALGTNGGLANNGLPIIDSLDWGKYDVTSDENDLGLFKIPSLRNLVFTAPYMHDGRFSSLEEVLDFYSRGVESHVNLDAKMNYFTKNKPLFSEEEKHNILAFLMTLTDSTFVENPLYRSASYQVE